MASAAGLVEPRHPFRMACLLGTRAPCFLGENVSRIVLGCMWSCINPLRAGDGRQGFHRIDRRGSGKITSRAGIQAEDCIYPRSS